jgi:hypothetical protein
LAALMHVESPPRVPPSSEQETSMHVTSVVKSEHFGSESHTQRLPGMCALGKYV